VTTYLNFSDQPIEKEEKQKSLGNIAITKAFSE